MGKYSITPKVKEAIRLPRRGSKDEVACLWEIKLELDSFESY